MRAVPCTRSARRSQPRACARVRAGDGLRLLAPLLVHEETQHNGGDPDRQRVKLKVSLEKEAKRLKALREREKELEAGVRP